MPHSNETDPPTARKALSRREVLAGSAAAGVPVVLSGKPVAAAARS